MKPQKEVFHDPQKALMPALKNLEFASYGVVPRKSVKLLYIEIPPEKKTLNCVSMAEWMRKRRVWT